MFMSKNRSGMPMTAMPRELSIAWIQYASFSDMNAAVMVSRPMYVVLPSRMRKSATSGIVHLSDFSPKRPGTISVIERNE